MSIELGELEAETIRSTAPIGMTLIEYLANRGKTIDAEDYSAIVSGLSFTSDKGEATDLAHRFWGAYSKLVASLNPNEDPIKIYYSQLLVSEKAALPQNDATLVVAAKDKMFRVTAWSVAVLVVMIGVLAYAGAVTKLGDDGRKYRQDLTNLVAEKFHLLKDVPEVEPCNASRQNCNAIAKKIFEAGLSASINDLNAALLFNRETFTNPENISAAQATSVLAKAGLYLGILNGYVVPLLAGILGATLAILRGFVVGVQTATIAMKDFETVYIRIALGAISGITVGWFTIMFSGDDGVGALSPLAFSFAAGYSVEIIFSLLDRVVGAFVNPSRPVQQGGTAG